MNYKKQPQKVDRILNSETKHMHDSVYNLVLHYFFHVFPGSSEK